MATVLSSASKINKEDEIIAVMGPTGSGKSHLIDCLTESGTKSSGDGLKSVTQKVRGVRVKWRGWNQPIVFIDTPGFDDTYRTDLEVLDMIADWLKKSYETTKKLTGILYLHRITDNRMTGSLSRNLQMFGKLCGASPATKVLFVTTMWDDNPEHGETREQGLKDHYLKPMLDLGANMVPFKNDGNLRVWQYISRYLLTNQATTVTLLQEEMVKGRMALRETKAAKILETQLREELPKQASNEETRQKIQEMIQELKVPLMRRFQLIFAKKPKGRSVHLPGSM